MTAWFAWSLWRETRGLGAGALARGHHAPHLVHSAAMLYAFAALAGPGSGGGSGMAGMAGGSSGGMQTLKLPTLALVFVLALVAYTVRDLDRRACADGYFHVVGRRFAPAGPALATRGPGQRGPGHARPALGAGPAGGGDSAVATVAQPPGDPGGAGPAAGPAPPGPTPARKGCCSPRRRQGLPGGDGRHHGLHADHHDLVGGRGAPGQRTGPAVIAATG